MSENIERLVFMQLKDGIQELKRELEERINPDNPEQTVQYAGKVM
jgi:hypothetical protein